MLVDNTLREYRMQAGALVEHAPIEFQGRALDVAVEPVRQLLLVQDGWVDSELAASSRVGDQWVPFCTLTRTPQKKIDIGPWTVMGPNRLALFDDKFGSDSNNLKIYEFA